MTFAGHVLAVTRKELRQIRRDGRTLAILLFVPRDYAGPVFIGFATPKLGRAPGDIPPTPFLRPNALIYRPHSSISRQRRQQLSVRVVFSSQELRLC